MKKIFLLLLLAMTSACSHSVHLVHVSDQRPGFRKGTPISAKSEQFVILGFASDTDYVNNSYQQLQAQCPNKSITAITTKFYTSHGFFSWTNHVDMEAYCL